MPLTDGERAEFDALAKRFGGRRDLYIARTKSGVKVYDVSDSSKGEETGNVLEGATYLGTEDEYHRYRELWLKAKRAQRGA